MAFNLDHINGNLWNNKTKSLIPAGKTYKTDSTIKMIKLPKTLKFARMFFSCDLTGVYLEREIEGDQIYWEKRNSFYDIMAANYDQNPVITGFTQNYLEDTGWYVLTEGYNRPTNWGFRRSCDIIGTTSEDFCLDGLREYRDTLDKKICTMDFLSKGVIEVSSSRDFMENCKIARVLQENQTCVSNLRRSDDDSKSLYKQEYFGPDSRCFMGSYHHINVGLSEEPPFESSCQKSRVIYFIIIMY